MKLSQEPATDTARATEATARPRHGRRRVALALLVAALIVAAVVYAGIRPRVQARAALAAATEQLAMPTVAAVHPRKEAPAQELVLPATVEAFTDSPIYARTSGYLLHWYADIGTHVKAGQTIAEIDTPEVDQQLQQAQADLATAQANLRLSQITAQRYQGLLQQDGVSKQDADNAAGDLAAKQSVVQSETANVRRLEDLENFKRIDAPFDGIITARNVDIGSLINAGAGSKELFHIAATHRLRVYVNVPQDDSNALGHGLKAELTMPQLPDRRFPLALVSTAGAIDPASRTLLTQFSADNPDGVLLPGAYAEVHLQIPTAISTYQVPISALLFRTEGPRIVTVDKGKAHLRQVVVGRDYGSAIEILSGLDGDDWVITDPPDSVVDSEAVHMVGGEESAPATGAGH